MNLLSVLLDAWDNENMWIIHIINSMTASEIRSTNIEGFEFILVTHPCSVNSLAQNEYSIIIYPPTWHLKVLWLKKFLRLCLSWFLQQLQYKYIQLSRFKKGQKNIIKVEQYHFVGIKPKSKLPVVISSLPKTGQFCHHLAVPSLYECMFLCVEHKKYILKNVFKQTDYHNSKENCGSEWCPRTVSLPT